MNHTKYITKIIKDNNNKYYWNITNKLGDIIFSSFQPVLSHKICEEQIKNVFTINNSMQIIYYVDKTNKHKCRIEDGFGNIVAISEGFEVQNYCQNRVANFYRSL